MVTSKFSWANIAIVLSLCLGSISYGYNFSIISTTVGQPTWYASMGLTADATNASLYAYSNQMIGTIFGLFSAGAIFGALFVGWVCDAYGRKKSLLIAAFINIIGGALQAGSVHVAMFIVARFVTGFSGAMFVTLVPIYIAEVAPPATRGLLVGQHGAFFLIGYVLAAWVGVGSYYSTNAQFNWRFPVSLQILWPLLMCCFIKWLPESPRWLVSKGQNDEAWQILEKLHSSTEDSTHTFAREEFYQITSQYAVDEAAYGVVSFLDLFRKPPFRKRMLIGTLVMWASQANGAIVIYSNIVGLVTGLGFSNSNSLLLSAGWITWACIGNFTNALFLDRLGRIRSLCKPIPYFLVDFRHIRHVLTSKGLTVIGITGCVVFVIIEAAIVKNYGSSTNKAALAAGVAMLFGFITFYGGFVDTTIYVYCSEIFPTHIRAKGMGWSLAVFFLSTLPFLESSTTGFATIGWKYYLLFIILPSINVFLLALFCPETKGLSLEEINGVFNDKVAVQLTHLDTEEKSALGACILQGTPVGSQK
ncbi:general substrate transporter [Melanomma pulvis-pyrius CBS 109.77]|uniref:General substrate transporter n=1 Tax=Melanomma pulvis-pyrius CBS 109.77 TaxID=1314802 RepID=A0A6A6X9D6_9PLEO|nr:general substrate transporter [Melanomma pulvis-pyrius CBS 109.77]